MWYIVVSCDLMHMCAGCNLICESNVCSPLLFPFPFELFHTLTGLLLLLLLLLFATIHSTSLQCLSRSVDSFANARYTNMQMMCDL